ncbi:hypothetical protein GCM10027395_28990 [Giesbergeria sinuosa]
MGAELALPFSGGAASAAPAISQPDHRSKHLNRGEGGGLTVGSSQGIDTDGKILPPPLCQKHEPKMTFMSSCGQTGHLLAD